MDSIWDYHFLNNTARDWTISFGIIILSITLLRIFQSIVIARLQRLSQKTSTSVDDLIVAILKASVMPLLYILAVYWGIHYLRLGTRLQQILHTAILITVTFFLIRIVTSIISHFFAQALRPHQDDAVRKKQSAGILLLIKLVIWIVAVLFLIDNLGYDITTIIAGLGIGGIAIALAAQTILGDLFSYIVIFFDKPFEIGDFIIVDEKMGTIEYIGIKTTRIRTLNGEQLICSNTDLTNSRVHNFKRMQERRIVFPFGVVYGTSADKLKKIPAIVREIIDATEGVRFDRSHFKAFGAYSLDFETVFYILSPDYTTYMEKQQAINLALFERFAREEIDFAFPTQTLILHRT